MSERTPQKPKKKKKKSSKDKKQRLKHVKKKKDLSPEERIAIELGEASFFSFTVFPSTKHPKHSEHTNKAAEQLISNIDFFKGKKRKHMRSAKDNARALLLNLVRNTEINGKHDWIACPRNFQNYKNLIGVTDMLTDIIDAMIAYGYLEYQKGFFNKTRGEGYVSRIKSTEKLLDEIIEPFDLRKVRTARFPHAGLIELRDEDRRAIPFNKDSREITRMTKALERYNALLQATEIDLLQWVNIDNNTIYRVFNRSFDYTGRYYGGFWMQKDKGTRRQITLNGDEVIELDYKSLHPTLLYHELGEVPPEDPYDVTGIERSIIKQAVLIALNAEDTYSAHCAFTNHYVNLREDDEAKWEREQALSHQYKDIMDGFFKVNPSLEQYMFKSVALRLMHTDAQLMTHVINTATKDNIPVLSVHDSAIIAKQHKDYLYDLMMAAPAAIGMPDLKLIVEE